MRENVNDCVIVNAILVSVAAVMETALLVLRFVEGSYVVAIISALLFVTEAHVHLVLCPCGSLAHVVLRHMKYLVGQRETKGPHDAQNFVLFYLGANMGQIASHTGVIMVPAQNASWCATKNFLVAILANKGVMVPDHPLIQNTH